MTATANAILTSGGGSRVKTYSVWFGQHFNRVGEHRSYNFPNKTHDGSPATVSNLGDVRNVNTEFSASDFERLFLANHSSSDVTVDSLISIVYLIARDLPNFQRDSRGDGIGKIKRLPLSSSSSKDDLA